MTDKGFKSLLKFLGICLLGVLVLIAAFLIKLSWPALSDQGLNFITGTNWDPVKEQYSAIHFILGTLYSSFLAIFFALPLSIATALFVVEIANSKLGKVVSFMLEMLAAIPSVVYGLWGIFVLAPFLRLTIQPFLGKNFSQIPLIGELFSGPPYGVGMLAAGIILAIMVTPTLSSLLREIFKAVPQNQKEAALALGSTRFEMMWLAIIKANQSGIFASSILALGRALGETMAVTMLIGNRNEISLSLFAPAQTMASLIANEYAEASSELHLASLSLIGFMLFGVTFAVNGFARLWLRRIRGTSK